MVDIAIWQRPSRGSSLNALLGLFQRRSQSCIRHVTCIGVAFDEKAGKAALCMSQAVIWIDFRRRLEHAKGLRVVFRGISPEVSQSPKCQLVSFQTDSWLSHRLLQSRLLDSA